jgi:hypothetical protein
MSENTLAAIASETLASAPTQRPTATTIIASHSVKSYLSAAGLTKVDPKVNASKGGGLFVTFLNPDAPRESSATSIWFSGKAVADGLVVKDEVIGQGFFAKFQICDMVYTMPDGTSETRTKICGLGESRFVDTSDLF